MMVKQVANGKYLVFEERARYREDDFWSGWFIFEPNRWYLYAGHIGD